MQRLIFFLLLTLHLGNKNSFYFTCGRKYVNLNMAKDSAAYIFTQTAIADQTAINYIRKEWKNRAQFLNIWNKADRNLGKHCFVPVGLRREHLMAINAYSQHSPLYREFNAATRQFGANDTIYRDKFHFKSFHYLLYVALDKLKNKSHKTYRGVNILFNATKGEKIRLGQFASASLNRKRAMAFMNQYDSTLLKVTTRFGVPISSFSFFPHEEEVLIPPIEVFKIKRNPKWKQKGNKHWLTIDIESKGCQGITVFVDTRNGFDVKRQKRKCPINCQCFPH